MSYLNDNDIDNLMRNASEKYPLRTDSADWDRMLGALEQDPSLAPPVGDDKRRRRRFFWLFLLLPLGGIGYYFGHSMAHHKNEAAAAVTSPVSSKGDETGSTGLNETGGSGKTISPGKPEKSHELTGGEKAGGSGKTERPEGSSQQGVAGTNPGAEAQEAGRLPDGGGENKTGGPGKAGTQPLSRAMKENGAGVAGRGKKRESAAAITDGQDNTGMIAGPELTLKDKRDGSRTKGLLPQDEDAQIFPVTAQRVRTKGEVVPDFPVRSQSAQLPKVKDSANAKAVRLQTKTAGLYAGIIVAPDLSTVKFQSVKGLGFTGGILLGYQFNQRLSVESGIYLERKKYYTEGEYFNRKNMRLPANYELLDVDGSCNMLEIPLNLKYNLGSGERVHWFATAGMSSYLMSREAYDYAYKDANGYTGSKFWPYNVHSNYLFSMINLSLGYEQKLGKIGQLRLEPYVRIPVAGIGRGDLPVMSAGLNIGITRKIRF